MLKISKAIILSAGPNGLGALRSLNQENIVTDIITGNNSEPVLFSRLYNQAKVLEQGLNSEELLLVLMTWPGTGQVLIPTSDWYVDFIFTHQDSLKNKFKFVLPKDSLSTQFIDKQMEVELVKDFVKLPNTVTNLPNSADELICLLPLPLIIKPRSNELNKIGQKNIVIEEEDDLFQFYQTHYDALEYCIAQDLIIGGDENLWVCNCVFDQNGDLINAFTFQRLQLTPPHYGVTCYAESIENNEILRQVTKLGKGLGYIGPAMVEFKVDDRDQEYKYIEINPRLGLCNYFDTSCGKNNVYATYCLASGLEFRKTDKQEHRIFVSVYEDLYSRYRDNQSFFSIIKTYLKDAFKPHSFIYFAWRDPWPSIAIGYLQVYKIIKAVLNKI